MEMDIIVKWATILSPIIAVLLAWWTSRCGAKDTAKKIATLEDSTAKQIENIQKLAKLQAEIATIQLDIDLWEQLSLLERNTSEINDLEIGKVDNLPRQYDAGLEKSPNRHEKVVNLLYNQKFYLNQQGNLKGHINRLEQVKKELGLL